MTTRTIEPTAEQLRSFVAHDAGIAPLTMLNLLRYRAQADYSGHPEETACAGREAYRRYAAEALRCIEMVGGRVVFMGAAAASLIGPTDEKWDDVLLVEYPSGQAFLEMVGSARYRAIVHHRAAALADSRLVPMRAGAAAFQARAASDA